MRSMVGYYSQIKVHLHIDGGGSPAINRYNYFTICLLLISLLHYFIANMQNNEHPLSFS